MYWERHSRNSFEWVRTVQKAHLLNVNRPGYVKNQESYKASLPSTKEFPKTLKAIACPIKLTIGTEMQNGWKLVVNNILRFIDLRYVSKDKVLRNLVIYSFCMVSDSVMCFAKHFTVLN